MRKTKEYRPKIDKEGNIYLGIVHLQALFGKSGGVIQTWKRKNFFQKAKGIKAGVPLYRQDQVVDDYYRAVKLNILYLKSDRECHITLFQPDQCVPLEKPEKKEKITFVPGPQGASALGEGAAIRVEKGAYTILAGLVISHPVNAANEFLIAKAVEMAFGVQEVTRQMAKEQ